MMSFKKELAFILLMSGLYTPAFSQDTLKNTLSRNAVFIEAFGNGGLYSLNYDRIIVMNEKAIVSLRGGFTFYPIYAGDDLYGFIGEINFMDFIEKNPLKRKGNKFFEIGLALTRWNRGTDFLTSRDYGSVSSVRLGYRVQKHNGFFFRAGLMPVSFTFHTIILFPWAGLSFGKTF